MGFKGFCINCIAALIPHTRPRLCWVQFSSQSSGTHVCLLGTLHSFPKSFSSCLIPISIAFINHEIEKGLEHTNKDFRRRGFKKKHKRSIWISLWKCTHIWLVQRNWKQWEDPWHPVVNRYRITTHLDVSIWGKNCAQQKLEAFFESQKCASLGLPFILVLLEQNFFLGVHDQYRYFCLDATQG